MNSLRIARVAFPLPIDRLFDYEIPVKSIHSIQKGSRVAVHFNKKLSIGYVIAICSKSKLPKLNPILSSIDKDPVFSAKALRLAEKIKDYYVCSLGEALEIMLPHALKKHKGLNAIVENKHKKRIANKKGKFTFIEYYNSESKSIFLKAEICKRVKSNKRVILVVPELRMIESLRKWLEEINGIKVGIMHGKLSKKEALNLWGNLSLDLIDIVIGTRSSIFTQINNLDLIIIINDDNYAYKEDQVPYYNTVKVALMRSDIENCNFVLVSQVPSLKTWLLIDKKKALKNSLDKGSLPAQIQFTKINFKDKIDIVLANEIEHALEKNEKILILLDRKGFATSIFCNKCNETLKCSKCSCNLRFEYTQKVLICPRCNYKEEATEICPKCNCEYVKYRGLGIEKLESNIKRQFPSAKIISLNDLEKVKFRDLDYDIIISTRKIANYEEFKSSLTIIWDFDNLLNIGDFRSGEHVYQLLVKLLFKTKKKMIISTSLSPDFYLFKSLYTLNYEQFYKDELRSRDSLKLPPNYHLAMISSRSFKKDSAQNVSSRMYEYFKNMNKRDLFVSETNIQKRSKIRGKFYSYILLRSKKVPLLNRVIKEGICKFRSSNVVITTDIDPLET